MKTCAVYDTYKVNDKGIRSKSINYLVMLDFKAFARI